MPLVEDVLSDGLTGGGLTGGELTGGELTGGGLVCVPPVPVLEARPEPVLDPPPAGAVLVPEEPPAGVVFVAAGDVFGLPSRPAASLRYPFLMALG